MIPLRVLLGRCASVSGASSAGLRKWSCRAEGMGLKGDGPSMRPNLPSQGASGLRAPALSTSLWRQNQPLALACLYHPFLLHLTAGTLSTRHFASYAADDTFFLNSFARM